MAIRILFDNNHIPRTPTFVLANRNGNKLGIIPAININLSDHLNDASEIQFRVQRDMDGSKVELWDDIVDFKLIWCPEWDQWFEIGVEVNDGDSVSKSVTGKALGEAELSQVYLYNVEINTESDIAHDDYVVTVLYNETNPKGSLLNRIMEKVPHYSIGHVDSSIANLQRTFSFDGTTILDAFNEIAEEMDCLFVIDSGSNMDGSISRTVNAYDMESVCRNCGFRGVFSGACPDCGSDDVRYGYGEDTNIYVSSENLTDEITYTSNVDSVKNCFRLVGGDDLMTATIANCNPNGSGYLWYFSDAMREDMSEALKARLAAYDDEYAAYSSSHAFQIPSSMVSRYNALVTKYKPYRDSLSTISTTVTGYSALMNLFYDTIDFDMLLRNELMPSVEISTKTAATEAARLTAERLSPTAVVSLENISEATASSAVLALAKQTVDGNFQVKVNNSSLSGTTWTGNFKVTNYSDDEDTAISSMISVTLTDDQEAYLGQRINKILADGDKEIVDISDLFKASQATFENEIKKYCLNSLNSMRDICQSCMDLLIENGVADEDKWATAETDLYTVIYLPFYDKYNALVSEVALRESEIATVAGKLDENGGIIEDGLQTIVIQHNSEAQEHLDFEAYLGTELMKELAAYRREDTYENSNFISDGLSNQEAFARALEFIELAKKEIYKSATLQHSITSNLKNLLVMREFASLTNQFEVGNWLSVGVDDSVYRLRLVTYEIDFDRIEEINVEFSDVIETPSGASDIESILSSASSMATSFGSVKRQAKRGDQSHATLTDYMERGLSLTNMKIVSSADNQNVTIDQHGVLCREAVPYNEDYDERQLKIINRGLYLTKDGWRTSSAGIGDFLYYDPEDGELKQDYGVIADVLMGKMMLTEKVGVYTENGSVKIDKNGFTLIANPESEEGAGDQTVFRIQRAVEGGDPENVIWFDSDGDANFNGKITVTSSIGGSTIGDILDSVGAAITGVDVEYNQTQSSTTAPAEDDPGWQTEAYEWRDGWYIWQRTATTTSSGTTYSDPVCISGAEGRNGLNQATMLLYQRANSAPSKPQYDLTYTFPSHTLSGNMGNWSQTIPTSDGNPCWVTAATATSYSSTDIIESTEWADVVKLVEDGEGGTNGLNQATIYLYKRAATTPAQPTGTSTYTFASGALSPVPTGWSRGVPAGTNPCWVTTAVAISSEETDSIGAGEWADVTKLVENGSNGANTATIMLYQRAENSPARPSGDLTYTFATATISGASLGNWTQNIPSGTNPCWVTAATAVSTGNTDTIGSGEWSAPVKLVENGEGTNGLNQATIYMYKRSSSDPDKPYGSSVTYTFATGELSSSPRSGWYRYIPSGDDPCYVSSAVAISSDATDSIGASEWSSVVRLVKNGDDGVSPTLIREQYYKKYGTGTVTNDNTSDSDWTYSQPAWESGYYIWTRSEITWSDGSGPTHTTPQLATALNGANEAANRDVTYRGINNTGASTAAKTVTCANFSLANGVSVAVFNAAANTVSGALTMNVNGTGAKTIVVAGTTTYSSNYLYWSANTTIIFTYDASWNSNTGCWRVDDSPGTWYSGTCNTAKGTATKDTTINEIVVFKGTTIQVPMTYENTASSNLKLRVQAGGAYICSNNIYYGTGTNSPTTANGFGWIAGRTATFHFDGAYWRLMQTSTILDGAHIRTGSITADQIATGTITADQIDGDIITSISTASANASSALSTANSASSTASNAQTAVNNANSQEQTIYKQAVSGTNSMAQYTTWVTATGESVSSDSAGLTPQWTTKRPTYRSKYPVLFVATQRKTVGGTVTCTTPLKDDTTTVIDGGHITTGTLDASKITVSNLSASSINSGTLDASTITVTNLSAGSINSGTLTAMDGIWLHNTNDFGFQVGPFGDIAIGKKLTSAQLSSFSNNKCAFQINNWGDIKVGGELGLWYSSNNNQYNYTQIGRIEAASDTIAFSKIGSNNTSTSIALVDGIIKFYTDANNPGSYSSLSGAGVLTLSTPLAVTSGGTGGANRKTAIDNLAFLGNNITSSTSADTRAFWAEKGTGYAWYSALDRVNGQPNQWGYMLSLINGNEVYQVWFPMGMSSVTRGIFVRSGNSSTTAMPAFEMMSRPILTKTMTSQTTSSYGNISFGLDASVYVVIGAYAGGNYGVIPYVNSSGGWGGKFYKLNSTTIAPATSVADMTVTILYMRLAI